MAYTNSQILSAVLNKWMQPVVKQLAESKMQSFSFVQAIENKVRSTGWVSPNWSLTRELSPMLEPLTNSLVQPMLNKYLSNVPDEAIPAMAHGIVDKAISDGKLELMEGKLIFDREDLEELKKLLNYNLPLQDKEDYVVKTSINEAETRAAI